ncbi:TetR/AcrR family transcriptional regulator [Nonomuraea sp. NPDC050536]|uniref:TetR/AcrR family transcriptional regulator n=1 Tax=Nonomuraea sp. NPDC050536 TaxID=3364366 RepID=UPI0037C5FF94
MARQRAFDRDAALESAIHAFWRRGYEATSVAELTQVMGIRPPSLYAAFGDKLRLFEEAVTRYGATYGSFTDRALAEEPTARAAIERVLRETAAEFTDPGHPPGCLVVSGAENCGPESEEAEELLRSFRAKSRARLSARIEADVQAGRLPAGTDPVSLSDFYATVIQGMSQQSRDGASRESLERVADLAMNAWPTGP